jgi:hypothetical protein
LHFFDTDTLVVVFAAAKPDAPRAKTNAKHAKTPTNTTPTNTTRSRPFARARASQTCVRE